jgi:ABC-type transport system involved in cytochrome bd biosynthesis fused ATPase/permease subunit
VKGSSTQAKQQRKLQQQQPPPLPLFAGVNLDIAPKSHIALLAPNGRGNCLNSTLYNITVFTYVR